MANGERGEFSPESEEGGGQRMPIISRETLGSMTSMVTDSEKWHKECLRMVKDNTRITQLIQDLINGSADSEGKVNKRTAFDMAAIVYLAIETELTKLHLSADTDRGLNDHSDEVGETGESG